MPKWIHDRARHIMDKNPEMPESEAFAISTQQSHSLGKSPKGYGTAEGKRVARQKYDTPRDDEKSAKGKTAGVFDIFKHTLPAVVPTENQVRDIVRDELNKKNGTHQHHSSHNIKTACIDNPLSIVLINGFTDELQKIKIAQLAMSSIAPKPTVVSKVTGSIPRNTMSASTPRYSQVNPASGPGPAQQHQPVLSPPPVRG